MEWNLVRQNDTWVDDRLDYVHNEVACDYNAAFTGCVAAMVASAKREDLLKH